MDKKNNKNKEATEKVKKEIISELGINLNELEIEKEELENIK